MTYFSPFSKDDRVVIRHTLAEQLPDFAKYLVNAGGPVGEESSKGYSHVLESVLPIFAVLLVDESDKVREAADISLPQIAALLKREDYAEHLFPMVETLARDSTEEEHRVSAAEHLNELASIIGPEFVVSFVLPLFKVLCSDPMFRVRKAIASNLNNIATQLGTDRCTEVLVHKSDSCKLTSPSSSQFSCSWPKMIFGESVRLARTVSSPFRRM